MIDDQDVISGSLLVGAPGRGVPGSSDLCEEFFVLLKFVRAQGGCLGTRSRRRTL